MIDPNSIYVDFGGLKLPITADAVDTTLVPLDPARSILLALFASAINSELGAVWTKVTNALPAGSKFIGTKPVQDTLELPPDTNDLGQVKISWPLLALCRTGEGTYDEITLFTDRLTQKWDLSYILGPVSIAEERILGDVCVAVAKLIRSVIRVGAHPSYDSGALQFFRNKAALAYINLKSQEGPGQAQMAGSDKEAPLFYAISTTLETWEVSSNNLDGYSALEGTDFSINLNNPDEGETIPDFIEAQT